MEERTLKVRQGRRDYTLKNKPNKGNPKTPLLLLKGTWLEKAGFSIDMPVSVIVHKNCLLLVPKKES